MNDDEVAALLDSNEPLVVIEAPAGCGKTYQGANYAHRQAARMDRGRILILTHTHAACGVFAKATRTDAAKVEIKTIDSLITQIAGVYHRSLDLPPDPSIWARRQNGGFEEVALRVSDLIAAKPMIAGALAQRFPFIVGDEHQDTSESQHKIMLALHGAGAHLRVFGDPMQQIFRSGGAQGFQRDRERWQAFKDSAASGELEHPHRWDDGSPELGQWVLQARERLKAGQPVDLRGPLPNGLHVLRAENIAQARTQYRLSPQHRAPIDTILNANQDLLVLTDQNATATALRAFWNRSIPIWEGHSRDALSAMANSIAAANGNTAILCDILINFMGSISTGFTATSHGNILRREINENCAKARRGKPALLQEIAQMLLTDPNHKGIASALDRINALHDARTDGFQDIKIDHRREFNDARRIAEFDDPDEALAELHRRRSYARPMPPAKAISTIHKAKGLQCDNALLMPCDRARYGASDYARCKLYVALSRAKRSLNLVVCLANPGPLFAF